jgi:hypothetical protein
MGAQELADITPFGVVVVFEWLLAVFVVGFGRPVLVHGIDPAE